ncbi:hypothetical protein BD779DRAFT_1608450 [Infundibulicybe gibba]|nr:hypothetical protein BD779DRAFT_1608450 [Infundibulicybe gibba]
MAAQTAQPAQASPLLCDYCHQKAKFSNHQYCSKTCAGQAAALCKQCHKKPKFQNFDFCGKNCAALAKGGSAGATQSQAPPAPKNTNYPKGNNFNKTNPKPAAAAAPPPPPTIDPVHLAQLVAQQIPHVQALLAPALAPQQPTNQNQAVPQAAPAPAPAGAAQPNTLTNNPFVNIAAQVVPPLNTVIGTAAASSPQVPVAQSNISNQPGASSPTCLIPGCEKPVHVDVNGFKTSDYCSMRHREEAVMSGIASPCIMCLTLPQSEADYFCSKACRDESLNKLEPLSE